MFHRWMTTDGDDPEDQCIDCGVVTPVQLDGAIADHSPLPIECPPPDDLRVPHHFVRAPEGIECAHCGEVIDELMDKTDVDWYCVPVA